MVLSDATADWPAEYRALIRSEPLVTIIDHDLVDFRIIEGMKVLVSIYGS
jgi:hypothetical protein